MTPLSKSISAFLSLLAISAPLVAQDKPEKPPVSPPLPTETKGPATAPTIPRVVIPEKKEETQKKAAPEKPKQYVVKAGDNPWLIAKNHGVTLAALLKVNSIKDPKSLNIGDVLTLPAGVESKNEVAPTKPEKEAPKPAAAPKEGNDWILYTIKKGDNPWNIAKQLKVDHQKIISLNKGTDFKKLDIGQEIKVPKKE